MSRDPQSGGRSALASLRRFVRPRVARERCELCGAGLADDHPHLVEPSTRRNSREVRTTTALTTSLFLTWPPGVATVTAAVITSPMEAYLR